MKATSWKGSFMSLVLAVFFLLVLVVLVCGMAECFDVGAQELEVEASHGTFPRSVDYDTNVPVCGQTENWVPNAGFEAGIGEANGWIEAGHQCDYDVGVGRDSPTSAEIRADRAINKTCMFLSLIDDISIDDDRVYDYSAWISATLEQGTAYLAITFWRIQNNTWKQVEQPVLTNQVPSTFGKWVQVTGSAAAPAEAQYARVEARLAEYSVGTVWFDDLDLSLSTCVEISKDDDPDEVFPGEVLTYSIVYSNTGRETATYCWVFEHYDEDVDLLRGRTEPPPYLTSDNVWWIGSLAPGERGMIMPVVRVKDEVEDSWVVNTVEITCAEPLEPISYLLLTPLPTDTCDIDLRIPVKEKTGEPGQTVSYDLELWNVGGCEGQCSLEVSSQSNSGHNLDLQSLTIPAGHNQSVTQSVHVPESAPVGTTVTTAITAALECNLPCSSADVDNETVETRVVSSAFFPLLMNNYNDRQWECYPNDNCEDACGPIDCGLRYFGYTDDFTDCWEIDFQSHDQNLVVSFTVDITEAYGQGVQVWITDYGDVDGCWDNTPEDGYEIDCPVKPGSHCFVIHTAEPLQGYDTPYIIRVQCTR